MNPESARRGSASNPIKRILLGNVCVLAVGLALAMGSSPAAAKHMLKHKPARKEHASKLPFGDMPKGPLEIFISISQQQLHLYSDGVHVADAPVATGVPGHLTPLGVFSVIQRDRYHHSNLYSNAPMPYMQRITWSGVALHEGPGVGHQASHGCIRMPGSFAARLWMLPTMGMRVIIARPELRPAEFADPHLFAHKNAPSPTAALPPKVETARAIEPGTKSDVVAPSIAAVAPAVAQAGAPAAAAAPAADSAEPDPAAPDSAKSATPPTAATPAAEPTTAAQPAPADIAKAAASEPEAAATASATPSAPAATPAPPATTAPADGAAPSPSAPAAPAPAKAADTPVAAPDAAAQPIAAVPAEAASAATAPAGLTAPISLDDVPLPLPKPEQIVKGSSGPIAIFVSRKAGKIYVRQNFAPLFDAPVKIADPKQPLGTHVFTAMDYLPDHSTFRWTVVTLPDAPAKGVERWKYMKEANGRRRRVRVEERAADSLPPETPQEALARIDIPQDVIDQISQLIVPGSSLVVSDQGLGPETGRGTDFIVVTR